MFTKENVRQVIRFCIIGGSNTVVAYIAYLIIIDFLMIRLKVNYIKNQMPVVNVEKD